MNYRSIYSTYMGVRRGGGQEGHLPPPPPPPRPLEIKKYGGPHKNNLTRQNFLNFFFKLSEETELRAPHLVSEETDMRGPL